MSRKERCTEPVKSVETIDSENEESLEKTDQSDMAAKNDVEMDIEKILKMDHIPGILPVCKISKILLN